MALKCHRGDYENWPGNRPSMYRNRLRDCGRNEDLCLSIFNKDDITIRKDVMPGGSFSKMCEDSSSKGVSGVLEDFHGDFSERCIESKKGLTVCNIDVLIFEIVNSKAMD